MTPGRLKLFTAPVAEPVTAAEAKTHLRVDHSADDTYIANLITQAREYVERKQERALMAQTWELYLDEFPYLTCQTDSRNYLRIDEIVLPRPPLQSVTHVKYLNTAGTLTTLTVTTDYTVQGAGFERPGSVVPAYGLSWPSTRDVPDAVVVRFVAGYASASVVPMATKQAILYAVGMAYANREPVITGTIAAKLEFTLDALMAHDEMPTYS